MYAVVYALFKKNEILYTFFEHRCNESTAWLKLLYQRRGYLGTGCGDRDPVIRALLGPAKTTIALDQHNIWVACPFKISFCEREGYRIDLDRNHLSPGSYDLSRNCASITRPRTDLKKLMALI